MEHPQFLYDFQEETKIRFVSFLGETRRFDLAVLTTENYFGKMIILEIQKNRFAIMGQDDLKEEEYLEEAFSLKPEEAAELKEFLSSILL